MHPILLCQISDLHIVRAGGGAYHLDPAAALRRCLATVLALKPLPDAVVLTGDLVDNGTAAEYAVLRRLLQGLPCPVYLLPGNHDERAALRAAFSDHGYLRQLPDYCQYQADVGGLRLLVLDTVVPGAAHGELCDRRFDWLEAQLARDARRPTIIALHHPPFDTGIGHMDGLRLGAGAARLEALVARHPCVERVICGHVHRTIYRRWAGTVVSACPAPVHHVSLDLRPGAPATYQLEPPGFHVHVWQEGQGVVTHLVPVGSFPGPFPF